MTLETRLPLNERISGLGTGSKVQTTSWSRTFFGTRRQVKQVAHP
jgi:hypothetical protein